jgi:hypothetical protein
MDGNAKYCFINTTSVRADRKSLELSQAKARAHAATQAYIRRLRQVDVGEAGPTLIRADDAGSSDICNSGSNASTLGTSRSSSSLGSPHDDAVLSFDLVAREHPHHISKNTAQSDTRLSAREQISRVTLRNPAASILQAQRHNGRSTSTSRLPGPILRGSLDPFFQIAVELKLHDLHLLQKCKSGPKNV